tara:strand:- start:225 stop:440 length:216 start_codon:yes stop_codon:yes gene_type:complete
MVVKYLGIYKSKCETCGGETGKHSYEWKLSMRNMYPKNYKTKLIICEKCAKRESNKKYWDFIRRNLNVNKS